MWIVVESVYGTHDRQGRQHKVPVSPRSINRYELSTLWRTTARTYPHPHSFNTQLAGPMWGGPLHNRQFVEKVQETVDSLDDSVYLTKPRIKGFLSLAAEVRRHSPASTDQRNWTYRSIAHHRKCQVE